MKDKIISIQELNEWAKELCTNPHLLIDDMSMDEFRKWIAGSSKKVLTNLLELLTGYEMYEHCKIVKQQIEEL